MPNIHSTISFGLVNIPVILNTVIKNNDISFKDVYKRQILQYANIDIDIENTKEKLLAKIKELKIEIRCV